MIGTEDSGSRIDRILRKRLALKSLSEIYSLIRRGGVRIEGKKVRQDRRVLEGDQIEIDVDPAEVSNLSGPDQSLKMVVRTDFFRRNFNIIHEDNDLLACNKPSGLVVHPGTGHLHHDTLIELATGYLLEKGNLREGEEPALVHRLDRDKLHDIYRSRDIIKQYIAVCHHRPPQYEGQVVLEMARTHKRDSGTKMMVKQGGVVTRSFYRITEHHDDLSKLEIFLETGKTHQIRVQLAHLGTPVVGDQRYGDQDSDERVLRNAARRLYLHAYRLSFPHPSMGKKMTISAPEPEEFMELMRIRGAGSQSL